MDDIEIHPRDNDVVAGTHGRGIYVLDDIGLITPRLYVETDVISMEVTGIDEPLFRRPRPATMFLYRNDVPSQGQGMFRAENPPYGAWFDYWLPDAIDGGVRFEIRDASGQVARTLDGPGAAGLKPRDLGPAPRPHPARHHALRRAESGLRPGRTARAARRVHGAAAGLATRPGRSV